MPDPMVPDHWREAALLIAGHGSDRAPASADAATRHAAAIAERGLFAECAAGFLKGGVPLDGALAALRAPVVYIVPHFMSAGYFVQTRIPEALDLDGRETARAGRSLRLTDPLASSPALSTLMMERAYEAAAAGQIDPKAATFVVVGHGSTKSPASSRSTREHAARTIGQRKFAKVVTAFLEQPPDAAETIGALDGPAVVTGFFAAEGFHGDQDMRDIMGLGPGETRTTTRTGDPAVYTGAIGADPAVADILIDLVRAFDARAGDR